ncbi:MAG: recombinase family protein [Clostridium sp.]|nr:recombinase family protein [Clostridium sp.]
MARTSRRNVEHTAAQETAGIYHTAIYARLSNEDGDMDTLENQLDLLKSYVAGQDDMKLSKVFSDNGYSGTNFERPQFMQMMESVKRGDVNCIVVKDLSRLGRNYIETGDYIEKVFPFLKVRFVAVTDGFDTDHGDTADGMIVSVKNLVNDVYAKDISRKIITAFRTKQKRGEYIGLVAPYGYLKDKEDKHRFVVDEATAPNVRLIYRLKKEGYGDDRIARALNERNIPSPRRYRYQIGVTKSDRYAASLWGRNAVHTILTNPAYLGHMVQGKEKQELCNNIPKHLTDKKDWIIVENCHEAIIDRQTFDEVQEIIRENSRIQREKREKSKAGAIKEENYLKSYLECGCCGTGINLSQLVRDGKAVRQYYCRGYQQWREPFCTNKYRVDKHVLEQAVLETIRQTVFNMQDIEHDKPVRQDGSGRERESRRLNELALKKKQVNRYMADLYADYEEGLLDSHDYSVMKNKYQTEYDNADMEEKSIISSMRNEDDKAGESKRLSELLKKYRKVKKLNRSMVECFIEKVIVYDKEHFKIIVKGTDAVFESLKGVAE